MFSSSSVFAVAAKNRLAIAASVRLIAVRDFSAAPQAKNIKQIVYRYTRYPIAKPEF